MELLQLRYFMTVARTLNISKAAQYHMIPQPAMSQTISRLEMTVAKTEQYIESLLESPAEKPQNTNVSAFLKRICQTLHGHFAVSGRTAGKGISLSAEK